MQKACGLRFCRTGSDLFGEDDRLGDLLHRLAEVAALALDALEGLLLAEPIALHQDPLCPFHELPRLQRLL